MEQVYQLKKTKLSTYQTQFAKLKKEILHFKWMMDTNLESKEGKEVRKKMGLIAKTLFEIENDFVKDQDKKK